MTSAAADCATRSLPKQHRVLFIGNSDSDLLAETYRQLVQSDGCTPGPISVALWARFGWALSDHADASRDPSSHIHAMVGRGWDYVVLQEQSQVPMFSRLRSIEWERSKAAVVTLGRMIGAAGAKVRLLASPAYRDGDEQYGHAGFESMQAALNRGYRDYRELLRAAGMEAEVIYAGDAWGLVRAASGAEPTRAATPFTQLYNEGGSKKGFLHGTHPSEAGVYLTACAVYAALLHASPVGIGWAPPAAVTLRAALQDAAARARAARAAAVFLPSPPPSPPPPAASPPPPAASPPPPPLGVLKAAKLPPPSVGGLKAAKLPPPALGVPKAAKSPPPPLAAPPPPPRRANSPPSPPPLASLYLSPSVAPSPPFPPMASLTPLASISSLSFLPSLSSLSSSPSLPPLRASSDDSASTFGTEEPSSGGMAELLLLCGVALLLVMAAFFGVAKYRSASQKRPQPVSQVDDGEQDLDDMSSQLFLMSETARQA